MLRRYAYCLKLMMQSVNSIRKKKTKAMNRWIRNICIIIVPIIVICVVSIINMPISWEKSRSYLLDQGSLYHSTKDFELQEGVLRSTSVDPWLIVNKDVDGRCMGVDIEVLSLNVDKTYVQVYYETEDGEGFSEEHSCGSILTVGNNRVLFPSEAVGKLRLDLTDEKGVEIALKDVSILIADGGISAKGISHIFDLIAMYLTVVCFFAIRKRATASQKKQGQSGKGRRKEYIPSFDFIRVVSTVGIVLFHFSTHTKCGEIAKYGKGWGQVFVTVFFILSGACLIYQTDAIDSLPALKRFYFARCKSLFPPFYIAFLFFFLERVVTAGTIYYSHNFFLTMLGMDGYFLYLAPNYYILGEWFLGAIILIYLLYPVLLKGMKKTGIGVLVLFFVLYILELNASVFKMDPFRNIISCLLSFCIGMVFMKNYERILSVFKKPLPKVMLYVLLFSLFLYLSFFRYLSEWSGDAHLYGTVLFFVLFIIGKHAMKNAVVNKVTKHIAEISFSIYLVHHVTITRFLENNNPDNIMAAINVLAIVFVITFISARSLLLFTKYSMG